MVMTMGWDCVSELRTPTGPLFIPQEIYEHGEPQWNGVERVKTPDLSTRALYQSYQQSFGSKQKQRAKGMMNLSLLSIFISTCNWFFTCRKTLQHGASGFTSPHMEGVLQIFIVLKIPSPWPGLNPRTLGLMTSTLTITPPRQRPLILLRFFFLARPSDANVIKRFDNR
jgi:hypothetical protein